VNEPPTYTMPFATASAQTVLFVCQDGAATALILGPSARCDTGRVAGRARSTWAAGPLVAADARGT